MNRDKVLELAKEAELARQLPLEVPFVVDRLERFAALIERELCEDAEPVAWSVLDKRTKKHWYTNESKYTAQHYAKEYSHQESDNTLSMVVVPLYTHPAPAVVRQLVEALSRMTSVFLDTEGSYGSYETDAIEFADQALAAAKDAGL